MIYNNRNKGSVTRQTDFGRTPLSDIFRGELRSRLQREGEHSTDDIQPFFTLQLNIEVSGLNRDRKNITYMKLINEEILQYIYMGCFRVFFCFATTKPY